MRILLAVCLLFLLAAPSFAQYNIYANDGTYLGMPGNQYDPNSINNPYGAHGSPYVAQSINNPYGQYGSKYSIVSPNDPYSTPATAVPVYGGLTHKVGGSLYMRY